MKAVIATCLYLILMVSVTQTVSATDNYVQWQAQGLSIPLPLAGLKGNPVTGRVIASDTESGNCLACHQLPIPEHSFHGNIGPDLSHVASRLSEAEIRLRVVDQKMVNPMTIMPGYYRHPSKFNQVSREYEGKTFLTAQQIEDVVAYLVTLK